MLTTHATAGEVKPVIAEIDGLATAAGCQLVASCDLAVASKNAEFVLLVNIGLFCSTPMVALSPTRKHCMQMLLTGEPISGQRAFEMGLVNMVVPSRELMATTLGIANKIFEKSRATIKRIECVLSPVGAEFGGCLRIFIECND